MWTESTRLICPAPTPTTMPPLASTMALLLTCLHTSQANRRSAISASVGGRFVTTFGVLKSVLAPSGRAACTSRPPSTSRNRQAVAAARAVVQRAGAQQADALLPGRPRRQQLKAASLKPGAMTHSMKRFGSVICRAVASSTSRLKASTPP